MSLEKCPNAPFFPSLVLDYALMLEKSCRIRMISFHGHAVL